MMNTTENNTVSAPDAASAIDTVSALDIIAATFDGSRKPDEHQPEPLLYSPASVIAAKFCELSPTRVIIIIDRAESEKIKERFAEEVLWTAEELCYFMERYFDLEHIDGDENRPTWKLRCDDGAKRTIDDAREHFIATCRVKQAFNGMLTRREL